MKRDTMARIGVGLTVLLFPYAGFYSVLPLVLFIADRRVRVLSASLAFLLLLSFVLESTSFKLPLYLVAVSFVAPTFGALASRRFHDLAKSLVYLATTGVLGCLAILWTASPPLAVPVTAATTIVAIEPERVLFLATLGGLSGAFLHSASRRTERDFAVPFGSCMVMWLFSFDYPLPELEYLAGIYVFALALGIGAYRMKAADAEAVLSEVIICLLVILFADIFWFLLLLSFYLLGSGFTRYKYAKKQDLRIAQSRGGVRGYKNVYSNSLVPLALAVLYGVYGSEIFAFAFLGSVATATGDTLASEIGETARSTPRMITTFQPVEHGVDGGVTLLGEAASVFGALFTGVLAAATGMTGLLGLVAALLGGFLGTNFDSLLGATLQSRGFLSNNGVNLFATLFGALVGAAIWSWVM
ncbi:MAG: TIGR00297 family protein [Methanothrix sp.]|nr:TIGR00297 family protein [Methanothrix harundinacea]MDD2637682.1 TIGR00297 family protein [Methanothrix sp.]MDD3710749.1 TIGR00297 family protein [Methanothrix sp.]MDD5768642.1 TIGR00297 family protein [Methanothrix sp.]MDI9400035.1 TIGR00297 family protein [Euryarchaeota archaeon]